MFGFADHQLMKCLLPVFQVKALGEDIRNCFTTISKWMNEFFLCLNPGKTKILIITPPPLKDKICIQGTFIDKRCVRFVDSAKNLGIIIDKELTFEPQVVKLVKSCFLVIRKISKIKSYLTDDQLWTVISTCVFSRIDYCNSLYYGISSQLLAKLQSVQNSAARLFRRKNCCRYVSPHIYIKKCHWLHV